MLFWPKLLSTAHAITISVQPFLPLFFYEFFHFSCSRISTLIALLHLVRVPACGFWSMVVEKRSPLHGVFTGLLAAIGTGAVALLLSIPPDTIFTWPAAVMCILLNGWFYQPLGVLVDSAILKILGDYKILYDEQRRWGQWTSAAMAIGIGWFLDEDHDFDTLLGTTLMGAVLLFLLSLSTNAHPVDPTLLGIRSHTPDQTTPLIKGTLSPLSPTSPTTPFSSFDSTSMMYKPYSLFGGQLSHISEDDEEESFGVPPSQSRQTLSFASDTASLCTTTTSHAPAFYVSTFRHVLGPHEYPSTCPQFGIHDTCGIGMACVAFALLPFPPPDSPLVALVLCADNEQERQGEREGDDGGTFVYKATLLASVTLLGCTCALMNTLLYIFLHDTLAVPMYLLGVIGMTAVVSELFSNATFHWMVERVSTMTLCIAAHALLLSCSFCYTWLPLHHTLIHVVVIILQAVQSYAFSLFWLTVAQQVNTVLLTGPTKRIMLFAKMSALYTGLGPAVGAILAGQLADTGPTGFQWIYSYAMGTVVLSSFLTCGWMIKM